MSSFIRVTSLIQSSLLVTRTAQPILRASKPFSTSAFLRCSPSKAYRASKDMTGAEKTQTGGEMDEAHQHQAGSTTHREEDQWKHKEPYKVHDAQENFDPKWKARCHCGKVKYELNREKPLASKYCHCGTCQKLHGSSFQHAAIFHKGDINFTHGHHDLGWYDPGKKDKSHHLPCKVSCAYCQSPIMDEGRNMILLFPSLIEDVGSPKGREAFKPTCHMFYNNRLTDFKGDGLIKWAGLDNNSDMLDDDGNVIVKFEEGMDEKEMDRLKRKHFDLSENEDSPAHKAQQKKK